MITELPESYLSSLDKVDRDGKLKLTPLRKVHSFLFGKTVTENRAWMAYLAIREREPWKFSISIEEVKKYAIISSNYYRSNPIT
jgi:hypothetical protein